MKKKIISALLAVTMIASVITGCGGSKDNADSNAGSKDDQLVYWSMWEETEPQGQVILEAVEKFNEISDIKLKVEFKGRQGISEGLEPALTAKQHIDIFDQADESVCRTFGKYALELDDLMEESGYYETAQPALIESTRDFGDGKMLAVPYQPYIFAMFYNKDIFEEAGIKETPKTWDEFLTVCEKIKSAGYIPLTTDDAYASVNFGTHLARYVGQDRVLEIYANGEWDDPGVLQTVKDYQDLAEKGYISPDVESNVFPAGQNSEFALGSAAMYFDGSWVPNEVKDITGDDFNWGCFSYPAVPNGVDGIEAVNFGAQAFAINKESKYPEEAFEFIKMMTQGEIDEKLAQGTLGIPACTETKEWPKQLADAQVIFNEIETKYLYAAGAESNVDISPTIRANILQVMGGTITAEQFVENVSK